MRLRVIGIGSPHGDDRVGLAVAQELASERLAGGACVLLRDRPGLDLVTDLRDADGVVLVDAMRGVGVCGTLRLLDPSALGRGKPGRCEALSSHGFGVGQAVALARTLGVAPPLLRVVGIEVASTRGDRLTPEVAAAIPKACQAVRDSLNDLESRLAHRARRQHRA